MSRALTHAEASSAIQLHASSICHRRAIVLANKRLSGLQLERGSKSTGGSRSLADSKSVAPAADRAHQVDGLAASGASQQGRGVAASPPAPVGLGGVHVDMSAVFRGNVPQVNDWLEAWAHAASCVAYAKQERLAQRRLQRCR